MAEGAPRRRIAVLTGARSDYGYLKGIMQRVRDDPRCTLRILVTGMHLEPRFNETWRAIEEDGFGVAAKIPLGLADDRELTIACGTGRGVSGIAKALAPLKPDLLVVLGDRYEILAAAAAALLLGVPIAHLHGGEVTEGAVDDAIRHAVTKMARLHFVATDSFRQRVVQMGERPETVFAFGTPSLDQLLPAAEAWDRATLAAVLGLPPEARFLLVTLHPETVDTGVNPGMVAALLTALESRSDHRLVFTGVNADAGNAAIDAPIRAFVAANSARAQCHTSLGLRRYAGALRFAVAAVGNSSSGLIEAPALGTPTVDIGARQAGRPRAASVVHSGRTAAEIAAALDRALDPAFRGSMTGQTPPYGRGGASDRIAKVLVEANLDALAIKRFHDLPLKPRS